MSRTVYKPLSTWGVVVLALVGLVWAGLHLEPDVLRARLPEMLAAGLLTALAFALPVLLTNTQLSMAHAVGVLAFLSLGAEAVPPLLLAIFVGGLLGALLAPLPWGSARLQTALLRTASNTLAFFLAAQVYLMLLGGTLPLLDSETAAENALPLVGYTVTYLLMYAALGIVLLHVVYDREGLWYRDGGALAVLLALPVPFAIIGATIARRDSSAAFFFMVQLGAVLLIIGGHAFSRAQQRMRRQLNEMRSISVATQVLRRNLELESLLRTSYVQVSQMLDADNFTVALENEVLSTLEFPLLIRDGEEVTVSERHIAVGLLRHVMSTQSPLLIRDGVEEYLAELRLPPLQEEITSWLGVPIIVGGKAIGAFSVQSQGARRFTADDLRLLNILVSSTSIAIENARLYKQKSARAEQLATLNQVTALLTGTLAPNDVLDTVVSSASTVSEANAVAVFLFGGSSKRNNGLELVRSAGLSKAFQKQPAMPGLTASIANSTDLYLNPQSLIVSNVEQAASNLAYLIPTMKTEKKRAFIETPLVIGSENLGILVLYYDQPQVFPPEQINLIGAFATQAAQAINNARTFASTDQALEQRVEQLYALAAMGRLLNATVAPGKLFQIVLNYATDATKAPRGAILMLDDHGQLHVPAERGYQPGTFDQPGILHQGLTGRVLQTGQIFRTTDIREETGYLPLVAQTRSMLAVPIMKQRDVLGMILLESDQPHAFSEGDAHFVAQIANQSMIALDNTRLFERIREARDRLQVILNTMREAILWMDEHGRITQANPRVDLLLDLESERLRNQQVQDVLYDEELHFAQRLGFRTQEEVERLLHELRAPERWQGYAPHSYAIESDLQGLRTIQRQIIPVWDEQHLSGVLLVFYDQTDERELEQARDSLMQMIVHDLRSPLTAVTTSLRLLQELVPDDHDLRPVVQKTTGASQQAIRKVLRRIDSLLDIRKMESGTLDLDLEPTFLASLVQNVLTELHPLAESVDVRLVSDVPRDLPMLQVDQDKVERMILNLVDNALKYSPVDSEITIRGRAVPGQSFLRLEVADQGPGIPQEYKTRLFERFVQVAGQKSARRGVGLGLTFCKLVAEAHGGQIWVEDNEGGGSIFMTTLPLSTIPETVE